MSKYTISRDDNHQKVLRVKGICGTKEIRYTFILEGKVYITIPCPDKMLGCLVQHFQMILDTKDKTLDYK